MAKTAKTEQEPARHKKGKEDAGGDLWRKNFGKLPISSAKICVKNI